MKNLLKPRVLFASMFYGVFCYLIIMEKTVPQELTLIVGSILGYYYGRNKTKDLTKSQ